MSGFVPSTAFIDGDLGVFQLTVILLFKSTIPFAPFYFPCIALHHFSELCLFVRFDSCFLVRSRPTLPTSHIQLNIFLRYGLFVSV